MISISSSNAENSRWSGRSWDLDEALNFQLRIKIIKLIHSGININSKVYYIDPTTYFQDWNSQCDITIKAS